MITIKRTDSSNPDFINLVRQLDKYLADIFGVEQKYYDQFNIINNSNTVVVAYENNSPVGCCCLREFDTNTVEIKRMFVPATHRNKGIATAILLELEKWAKELGYIKIILETGKLLTEANNLYQKHNYHVTEKWGQYVGVETSVCMKKMLA